MTARSIHRLSPSPSPSPSPLAPSLPAERHTMTAPLTVVLTAAEAPT